MRVGRAGGISWSKAISKGREGMMRHFNEIAFGALIFFGNSANGAPVSPTDFFTNASIYGQSLDYDTGLTGDAYSSASGSGGAYYNPSTGSIGNIAGPGFIKLSGGKADSSANLATGQLRAAAGLTYLNPLGYSGGYPVDAYASLGDTLYISAPSFAEALITTISYKVTIDGFLSNLGDATNGSGLARGYFGVGLGSTIGWPTGFNPLQENLYNGDSGVVGWYGEIGPVSRIISGEFSFTGSAASVPLYMFLLAGAQHGFSDFGHTAQFSFDSLPDGVSIGSASGVFLTESVPAVPLPGALPLFAVAFGGLGWVARRRRARI
jgi:hypothetical protein